MNKHINIVADAHIWGVQSAFSELSGYDVDLQVLENKDITRESLTDVDILLTRSATKVNADLLAGTAVRFAATATIGDDHYDKNWLTANNITWATAAGSSTGSVIEYMLAVFLELQDRGLISIADLKLGIIGVGRIGGVLAKKCDAMGMQVLLNDPPKQCDEGGNHFSSLADVLMSADVVTLHTPLIDNGEYQTLHLLDADFFKQFQGQGIINAARGACVDHEALADWLDADDSRWAVLDCWEHEPNVSERLLKHPQMVIATPHIAGHSLDGKAANTQYIYDALCDFLACERVWDCSTLLPESKRDIDVSAGGDVWADLQLAVNQLYAVKDDHERLLAYDGVLADGFVYQRRHYPVRRTWDLHRVNFANADEETRQMARLMGMKVGD